MARYVYSCSGCGKTFEVDKPMTEAARAETCAQCGRPAGRVFTPPALSVKGAEIPFDSGDSPSTGCSGCCDAGSCGAGDWND